MQRDFAERIDEKMKIRKAPVAGQAFHEAKINLLRDDGDFESAENVIKKHRGYVAPGLFEVHSVALLSRYLFLQIARIELHIQ